MAVLQAFPNETQKTQDVQNQQIFIALQNIYNWSSQLLSAANVDYTQESASNTNRQTSDLNISSNTYQSIPNFSFNFTPQNKLAHVDINLTLKGNGYLALYVNGLALRQIPFNNTSFAQVTFGRNETFKVGSNKVNLALKSNGGSVLMACSNSEPFFNTIQITSVNS